MRRWVNPSQPDLLQIATWLAYFRAAFTLLFGLEFQYIVLPLPDLLRFLVVPGLLAGGAYLMANGKRLGWYLLLAAAALPLAARLLLAFGIYLRDTIAEQIIGSQSPLDYDFLGLIFEVALLALLVHPRSRQYEKVWLE
jgi:hypothetical protein